MIKKSISIFMAAIVVTSFGAYAKNAVDSLIGSNAQYIILATITNVSDNMFELTKGYGIKHPENNALPDTFSVKKFKYGYCVEHADNYNNPQMGDNIIVAIDYSNGAYHVSSDAFMVDNVSSSAKVKIPEELKNYDCMNELLALGYYIHSDGVRREYEYSGSSVYAIDSGGEKFEINKRMDDYVVFFNKNKVDLTDKPPIPESQNNVSRTIILFLACGMVFGILCVISANYILNRKDG